MPAIEVPSKERRMHSQEGVQLVSTNILSMDSSVSLVMPVPVAGTTTFSRVGNGGSERLYTVQCAALCCVLRCAVCCAVLCAVVLHCAALRCAALCCAVLHCAALHSAAAALCAALCCMLCCAVLCCAVLGGWWVVFARGQSMAVHTCFQQPWLPETRRAADHHQQLLLQKSHPLVDPPPPPVSPP
eukprot:696691-Prymnesium_polylepis.1